MSIFLSGLHAGLAFTASNRINMKNFLLASILTVTQLIASSAAAQTPPTDKGAARAERKAQGAEAVRTFKPGEGDPKPEPKAKVSREDRISARQLRKPEGVNAARTFMPGEGDPKPEATTKLSREERSAGRKASRADIARANKAGQLPSLGNNYPGNEPNGARQSTPR